jgi:hypothetical protein
MVRASVCAVVMAIAMSVGGCSGTDAIEADPAAGRSPADTVPDGGRTSNDPSGDGGASSGQPDAATTGPGQARTVNRYLERCTRGAGEYVLAEHAYPGKSAVDLVGVRAVARYVTGAGPADYTHVAYPVYLKDGAVGVTCSVSGAQMIDEVVFIDDF